MIARLLVPLLLALSVSACCCGITDTEEERVRVTRSQGAYLSVTNRGDARIHYIASDPLNLALMSCTPTTCESVAPGETVSVSYANIHGWDDGDPEAVVSWWEFDEGTGQTRAHGTVSVRLLE